jgi:hypothetical protein
MNAPAGLRSVSQTSTLPQEVSVGLRRIFRIASGSGECLLSEPIVLKKSRLSGLGPILRNDDSIGAASLNH